MNLITVLKRIWREAPEAAPAPEAKATPPKAESLKPTAALDAKHITPGMQRLVEEIGAELAANLAGTIALAIEMRHRREGRGDTAIDGVLIHAWDTLVMLANRVRANRPALMERDEAQLVEAVVGWCAMHLQIIRPVQLRELV